MENKLTRSYPNLPFRVSCWVFMDWDYSCPGPIDTIILIHGILFYFVQLNIYIYIYIYIFSVSNQKNVAKSWFSSMDFDSLFRLIIGNYNVITLRKRTPHECDTSLATVYWDTGLWPMICVTLNSYNFIRSWSSIHFLAT
jgi:hypothetical protein